VALLNTHKEVENLISAGVNKRMAEAILDLHVKNQDQLATKTDIEALKEATKTDIAILRSEMNSMKTELKSEIALVESRLESNINDVKKDVNWIKTISMATFTILLGTLVTLIIQYVK